MSISIRSRIMFKNTKKCKIYYKDWDREKLFKFGKPDQKNQLLENKKFVISNKIEDHFIWENVLKKWNSNS